MNRIFHARIAIGQYLFLVLTTIIVIYAMWMQHAVMAILFMLLLVIAIERLIHTTYTLTADDRLLLFYGRFSRSEEISLKDIISVERASSMKIGRAECGIRSDRLLYGGRSLPYRSCRSPLPSLSVL